MASVNWRNKFSEIYGIYYVFIPNFASNSSSEQYSPHVNTLKSIQVYLLKENSDSEYLPCDLVFRNVEDFKQQLCNFVGM